MKKYKILNLYACLGGNRYKWDEVSDNLEVTAVELDPELARLYQERFPNDIVIIADAHQYLLDHFKEFDFIWSSPPCPSHSRMRKTNTGEGERKSKATYPDMKLYEEILLLQHFFQGKYVVENVIPYYEPLITAIKRHRHLYWTNFNLPNDLGDRKTNDFINCKVSDLSKFHDFDFSVLNDVKGFTQTGHTKGIRIEKIARNLVDYEAGKTILQTVLGIETKSNNNQISMF
jgi:DNA (cytosine-5)-methyltransferase 1